MIGCIIWAILLCRQRKLQTTPSSGLETTPAAAGNVYTKLSSSLTLECKIDNQGTVTWTKDGAAFDDGAIYSAGTYNQQDDSQTSSLTFASVSQENAGVYICTFESLSATFTIDVFGKILLELF